MKYCFVPTEAVPVVQNVISYWLFLSEQPPQSHLSFTETCNTWNKLKEPPEPFEPEGAGRVHTNLHVNNYIYIKMFIVRPSPPVWRFWVVCIWLHLVTKMCVWVGLECGRNMIAWRLWGLMMVEERNFVFFCKLFTLPGYSGCMCTILRPQGGTLNASSHQNLSLAVRFMDKEASVGEIACTEMAQNYTHRLCVVESELFSWTFAQNRCTNHNHSLNCYFTDSFCAGLQYWKPHPESQRYAERIKLPGWRRAGRLLETCENKNDDDDDDEINVYIIFWLPIATLSCLSLSAENKFMCRAEI